MTIIDALQSDQPRQLARGPKGLNFLKTLIGFYANPIRLFDDLYRDYGAIVRLQGGPYSAHLITQPEHIKYVLQDNSKNYHLSGTFDETMPVVGKGLTTNNGASWLRERRMVQSAFHRQHIAAFAETITTTTDYALRSEWQDYAARSARVQIDDAVFDINRRILARLLFSADMEIDDPFFDAFDIVRKVSIDRVRSIISLPAGKKYRAAIELLDAFTYQQIRDRHEASGEAKTDILSLLMAARDEETGESMTDTELHDEIMTLFFAAYEDVANAVAWAWYLLAQNPDAESKLYSEIDTVLGERAPGAADLRDLPYLTMVVNEVLRLYPPTWSLLRDAVEDDTIGGYHIAAGSMVIFDLYLTHRLPEFWDDPERFDPQRFSSERSAGRPRFAYLPFGGGARQCIGNELALMEIKLIIARMAQMFRLKLVSVPPIRLEALTSLRPRGCVWMALQSRASE